MNKGMPLIFFHKGDSYYLQYTLNQVLKSNPDSDIYLIGDEANKHYESIGLIHVDMSTCEKTAKEFEKIYVHLSSMNGFVERICFQRWMYIRDFVLNQGIDGRFCCLDSDVLVYENITNYHDRFCGDADVVLQGKYGPACTAFKNVDVLTKLVDNSFKYYTDEECLDSLKYVRNNEKDINGNQRNITDMYMIEKFVEECDVKTFNSLQIFDDITFDGHITQKTDNRFKKKNGFKKVVFRDGKAYCESVDDGHLVKMVFLHIQGFYKVYMYRYYTGDPSRVDSVWKARLRLIYQLIRQRVAKLVRH